MRRGVLLVLAIFLQGCLAPALQGPWLVRSEVSPEFRDRGSPQSLRRALEHSREALSRSGPEPRVVLGGRIVTAEDLEASVQALISLLGDTPSRADRNDRISEDFDLYEVRGPVLFTGYFEPRVRGSLVPTRRFRYPLYRSPEGPPARADRSCAPFSVARSRHAKGPSREAIDSRGILSGRGLELLYLEDPVERFFLHVQGSGVVELPDGQEIHVQYEGSNDRPYTSIGAVLVGEGKLGAAEATLPRIREYLRSHPQEQQRIMNRNQRYVFFTRTERGPLGVEGVPLTPLRSLATDPSAIPPGTLCYLETRFPECDERGLVQGWKEWSGFAVSQDAGKAIQGPHRADLFLGSGSWAERTAGCLRARGRLYLLLRKRAVRRLKP